VALFNGPAYIEPPPPPVQQYGIFDVALGPMPFPSASAQGGGVIYVPDDCEDDVFLYSMQCPAITGTKTFSAIEAPVSGAPFGVLASYTCGSLGFSFAEAEQRVRTRLSMREQRAVERRLWQGSSGVLGTVTGLFRNATNLGSAACPAEAIGILEQTLADNGVSAGIIHARPGLAAPFAADHLIERVSPRRLTTMLGTPYVFGQGYDGTGPTGQATTASAEWVYATGRVLIWRNDEVFVPDPREVLDRSTNQLSLVAERIFAAAVECGVWAIQVTHSCTTAGEG
jgi:hypothetical protein